MHTCLSCDYPAQRALDAVTASGRGTPTAGGPDDGDAPSEASSGAALDASAGKFGTRLHCLVIHVCVRVCLRACYYYYFVFLSVFYFY